MTNTLQDTKTKKKQGLERGSTVFYALLMIFPVAQFLLFYVWVNFKSFGYAFLTPSASASKVWDVTFKNITSWFTNESNLKSLMQTGKMSLLFYGVNLGLSIPLGLLFSYYVFKKLPLSGMFRIFLFIPSIIPAAAFVLAYRYLFNEVAHEVLSMPNLRFDKHPLAHVLFYNFYVSFGTSVLMYANKMFDISPEVIEAGKLDGAIGFKEFWHIVLPLTFPTLSVFLITGVATIFTNQYNLFLFKTNSKFNTLGYHLYILAGNTSGFEREIPPVAALGLILTAIAAPLTFLVKFVLEKFGPSED